MRNYYFALFIALFILGCSNKPSTNSIKKAFESTVLKNINSTMLDNNYNNYSVIAKPFVEGLCDYFFNGVVARELRLLDWNFPRLLSETRKNEIIREEAAFIISVNTISNAYLNTKIGPFGQGYKIKTFNVKNGQKQLSNKGVEIYVTEYEATLEALSDIENYSLPDVPGIKLDITYTATNLPRLNEFDKAFKKPEPPYVPREIHVLPKGGEYKNSGKLIFEKTDNGWRCEDGNIY
jgi:hypothetical protein